MPQDFVLAIDQGTTSTRAMLFTHQGTVAGVAQEEHEQIYPQAGWVEHDPTEIWAKAQQVTSKVLRDNGLSHENVAAVGITNQRETTVVWDKRTGEPVYNAIVWQDTRTQPQVSRWKQEGYEPEIQSKTGLVIATYFSGTKIAWILENVDGVRERAEAGDLLFGNTDTWLIWNLTGGTRGGQHITDYTNASRTMLFNLADTDWDQHILDQLGIPRALLPELRPSSDAAFYGQTTADGVLGGAVPVCGDAGGAYFVPAFSGLFAPYWDEKARGVLVGLTRYVNRAHLVRATLESMCYQSRDVAEAVAQDSGKPLPDLRVDGGAVKNDFLMQLQADVLGIPVIRPQVQETTALGAAYLAGLATGYWSSLDEMRDNWQVDRVFEPSWSEDQREHGYAQWKKAVERTRAWLD